VVLVIFEYKLRLEKSLQQEKADHRKTREELEKRADSEKEANNKHSALQQQYKLLQVTGCSDVRGRRLHISRSLLPAGDGRLKY
jgi:lipid II:glycine glycyltransferase (peptidoglycan interpeptide bridge formation enzyme)